MCCQFIILIIILTYVDSLSSLHYGQQIPRQLNLESHNITVLICIKLRLGYACTGEAQGEDGLYLAFWYHDSRVSGYSELEVDEERCRSTSNLDGVSCSGMMASAPAA